MHKFKDEELLYLIRSKSYFMGEWRCKFFINIRLASKFIDFFAKKNENLEKVGKKQKIGGRAKS